MEDNNVSLIDERIKELAERLATTVYGSDEYNNIVKDMEVLAKVRESYVKGDLQRMDNNAKNDIAEAELAIKEREAHNGKVRNIVTLLTTIFTVGTYTAGSFLQNRESYRMEETTLPYKPAKESAKDLWRKIK